jgi:hypothetical protein
MNYVMLDRLETQGYLQACTEISSGFIIEVDKTLASSSRSCNRNGFNQLFAE